MSNLLFDHPEIWQDTHDIGPTPPSVWNGTSYIFNTANSTEGLLSLPLSNYPDDIAAGNTISGHVAWTTDTADVGEFTIVTDASPPLSIADEFLSGTSGEFDFSYTFDGTEFGTFDNPTATGITIQLSGGGGEIGSGATAVLTPQSATPVSPPPPPPPPPPPVVDCDEIGRTSRAYASAHYRTRIHDVRLMSGEKRCLVADFNGAISSSRTIASVKWRCDGTSVAIMATASIQSNSRAAAVDVTAGYPGTAFVRCEATLDNGEVYIQPFRVAVSADPYFVTGTAAGPTELTATAS